MSVSLVLQDTVYSMLKAQVNVSEVYISPNKEPQIPYVLLCVSEAALEWPSKASKEKQMSTFLLKLLFGVIWVFFSFYSYLYAEFFISLCTVTCTNCAIPVYMTRCSGFCFPENTSPSLKPKRSGMSTGSLMTWLLRP